MIKNKKKDKNDSNNGVLDNTVHMKLQKALALYL